MFTLHPQLAGDSFFIADLALCRVLLMNNACFPWLILVPRRDCVGEIVELSRGDGHLLMNEIVTASKALQRVFAPDKLNVAALGNKVAQLHIHVVARFRCDAAWPEPVWGHAMTTYDAVPAHLAELRNCLQTVPPA